MYYVSSVNLRDFRSGLPDLGDYGEVGLGRTDLLCLGSDRIGSDRIGLGQGIQAPKKSHFNMLEFQKMWAGIPQIRTHLMMALGIFLNSIGDFLRKTQS